MYVNQSPIASLRVDGANAYYSEGDVTQHDMHIEVQILYVMVEILK